MPSETITQVSNTVPWEVQQPFLDFGFNQAQQLYNQGPMSYYPGQQIAPFSAPTEAGMGMVQQRAADGSPINANAQTQLNATLQGGYMGMNPGSMPGYGVPGYGAPYGMHQQPSLAGSAGSMPGGIPPSINNYLGGGGTGGPQVSPPPSQRGGRSTGTPIPRQQVSAGGFYGGMMSGNNAYQPSMNRFTATMGNPNTYNPSMGFYGSQMGADPNANPATSYLHNAASGNMLNGNPYLDSMYDRAASSVTRNFSEATAPGIDSAAISAGRYGSGAWENQKDSARDQLGRSLEGLASNIYGSNYAQERGLQQNAAGQIQGAYDTSLGRGLTAAGGAQSGYQTGTGLGLQAAGQAAGTHATGLGQGLQAAGQADSAFNAERNRQIAGTGMSPTLANQDYFDAYQMMNVGGMQDSHAQDMINADMARHNFNEQSPWMNLQNYNQAISGNYGSSTSGQTTQPLYQNSPYQNALAGGLTGLGLANEYGWNPWIAGGLGLLGGAFI